MKLFTNNGEIYDVKWVEYWNENERFFLAETIDGEELKIDENDFNKLERSSK